MESETVSAIANCVTALAAVGGLAIAARGLRTWQEELRGRTEYELARQLLVCAYRVREGIRRVRNPIMMSSEYAERPGHEQAASADAEDAAYAYQRRWEHIATPMLELDSLLLEAEAHWGDALHVPTNHFRTLVGDLRLAITRFLRAQRDGQYAKNAYARHARGVEETIYAGFTDEQEDPFELRVAEATKEFEAALCPKLQR